MTKAVSSPNRIAVLGTCLALQLGALAAGLQAVAQDAGFELLLEIKNLEPTAFFAGGGIAFVGDDILVTNPETYDRECEFIAGVRFNCAVVGEVTLYDGETGEMLLNIKNPSPDEVDTSICATLDPPDPTCIRGSGSPFFFKDGFGEAIAPFGDDKFLVGAWMDNSFGCSTPYPCRAGLVYLYDTSGTLLRTFKPPVSGQFDEFGRSVSSVGNKVLVGAPGVGLGDGRSRGAVFMFDGDTGEFLREIPAPDPVNPDLPTLGNESFGHSVAGLGDVFMVGDPRWDASLASFDAGRIYLFDAAGDLITRPPRLTGTFTLFGSSIVALDDEQFAVAAPNFDLSTTIPDAGVVRLYGKSGSLEGTLLSPEPLPRERFGCGLGTDCVGRVGSKTLIGRLGGSARRQVSVFGDGEVWALEHPNSSSNPLDPLACSIGSVIGSKGNRVAIVGRCSGDPDAAPDYGSLFVYRGPQILEGSIKGAGSDSPPLKRVKVTFVHDAGSETTYTNDEGVFQLDVPPDATHGALRVTLNEKDDRLAVADLNSSVASFEPAYVEVPFVDLASATDARTEANLQFDVGLVRFNGEVLDPDPATNVIDLFRLSDLALTYVHMIEYIDWTLKNFPFGIIELNHLDVGSRECFPDLDERDVDRFSPSDVRIELCDQTISDLFSQFGTVIFEQAGIVVTTDPREGALFTLGHEFGHYIEHQSLIGGLEDMIDSPAGTENHGGYRNADSSDSLSEGFASFWSAVMNLELHGFAPAFGSSPLWPFVNLDQAVLVPGVLLSDPLIACDLEYVDIAEEFAVATLLWDLYDVTNEPDSGDTFRLSIGQIYVYLTQSNPNPTNPDIIRTIDDVRTALTTVGLNVDELFIDRFVFLDSIVNCSYDAGEVIGVTDWIAHDSENDLSIGHELPRHSSKINPRQNILLEVFDAATGEPLTDFLVLTSVEFEPPNDIYDFQRLTPVDSSPYVFKGVLFQPSTLQIGIFKDDTEVATVEMTYDEFWTAYRAAPTDVGQALIRMNINGARLTVNVDIKPGEEVNSINLGSNGLIPFAILTTDAFDAATVNQASVTLAGAVARVKGRSGNIGAFEDVDGDGDLDLVLQIPTEGLALTEVDTSATVEGQTLAGTPFTGTDTIRIVPP